MARRKVRLAWIANDAARRATFRKRRKGLLKKVSEISTLCGVDACGIVYGLEDHQPETWPPAPEAAHVLTRFKNLTEYEQTRKMVNHEGFIRQQVSKLQETLYRTSRENRELEVSVLLKEGLLVENAPTLSIQDASSLAWMSDSKLKAVRERIELARQQMMPVDQVAAVPENPLMNYPVEAMQGQSMFMMEPMDPINYGTDQMASHQSLDFTNLWMDPSFTNWN